MEINEKIATLASTPFEQSQMLFLTKDKTVKYWCDWAKKFIKYCEDYMGWEVVKGPGNSLGLVMQPPFIFCGPTQNPNSSGTSYGSNYGYVMGKYYPGGLGYDCDWTEKDGVDSYWTNSHKITFLKYKTTRDYDPLPTLEDVDDFIPENIVLKNYWFKDFEKWNNNDLEDYIDIETGRFDFIVYIGENQNGEKIGFRVKYPVCSNGYSDRIECLINYNFYANEYYMRGGYRITTTEDLLTFNAMYQAPVFSLYNSEKGRMNGIFYVEPEQQIQLELEDVNSSNYKDALKGKVYVYNSANTFGEDKKYSIILSNTYDNSSILPKIYAKTDKLGNDIGTEAYKENVKAESWDIGYKTLYGKDYTWSKDFQDEHFQGDIYSWYSKPDYSIVESTFSSYSAALTTRGHSFDYYKSFNLFSYHISKNKTTQFLEIKSQNDNYKPALQILTTTLESGEKVVMIGNAEKDKDLCNFYATTSSSSNSNNNFHRHSLSSFKTQISDLTQDCILQKLLLPGTDSFCVDLYSVLKLPKLDVKRQYIYHRDENGEWQCFRIIDLNSEGLLAFPVLAPGDINES